MKLIEQKEPYLANLLSSKKQKRKSYKKDTVLKNRSFRRYLKMNLEVGKEILKNDMDLNFNNVVGELRLNFTDKGEPEECKKGAKAISYKPIMASNLASYDKEIIHLKELLQAD